MQQSLFHANLRVFEGLARKADQHHGTRLVVGCTMLLENVQNIDKLFLWRLWLYELHDKVWSHFVIQVGPRPFWDQQLLSAIKDFLKNL